MEITLLEDKKDLLVFELTGESHGLCNALRKALWSVKGVKLAGYEVAHPLTAKPKFTIKTDGADPKKALEEAVKLLKNDIADLQKNVDKEF